MKICILFFALLIISCSETIMWNTELKNCSFEFRIFNSDEATQIKYLFLKNLDNSSVTYNFICEKFENTFSGEVISGTYFVACYFLAVKTVNEDVKFYTRAYYVDTIVFSADSDNKRSIEPVVIEIFFKKACYEGGNIRIDVDLSNDFFQLYKISAFSVRNGGKNKSYDSCNGSSYYFQNVNSDKSELIVNVSYSVKNYYDKNFLLEHEIKLTTTRFENLDISYLIK
ncbi:MAG: hypothetical protein J1G30_06385 [Spirochaetales bacterium]|nr:hypothetical protein [Spirochaetales bacterium]